MDSDSGRRLSSSSLIAARRRRTSIMSVADYDELETATRRGQILLDKLQYAEAESVFRDVLRRLENNPPPPPSPTPPAAPDPRRMGLRTAPSPVGWQDLARQKADKATTAAVAGLGETFARQSRTAAVGVTDWVRLMVHALSLHRDAAELARRAERRHRGRLSDDDAEFFKDAESLSVNR